MASYLEKEGENFEGFSRNLFVCLPSRSIKALNWTSPISDWIAEVPDLPYPAVHSLAGYRRGDIAHPLDGFGVLVPSEEPHRILGALFNSELYPNRAPEDHCLLTAMLGGSQSPELREASDEELLNIAKEDLARVFSEQALIRHSSILHDGLMPSLNIRAALALGKKP